MSKDSLSGIDNYPPAIADRVWELGLIDAGHMPHSKKVIIRKGGSALVVSIFVR